MSARAPTQIFTLVVRYSETDAQGVVHHANYLKWFEEGRSEFLRQQGLNYGDMEREGCYVIVVQASVDYKAPSYFEDRITVATTLEMCKGRMLEFSYVANNQAGVVVAEGYTKHFVIDAERRLVSMPEKFRQRLNSAAAC